MPEANDSFDGIEDTKFPVDPAFETEAGELEAQHVDKTGVAEAELPTNDSDTTTAVQELLSE